MEKSSQLPPKEPYLNDRIRIANLTNYDYTLPKSQIPNIP